MLKRLILSVSLLFAVVPVRADDSYDVAADVSNISTQVSDYLFLLEDIGLIVDDVLSVLRNPTSVNFWAVIGPKLLQLADDLESIKLSWNDVYPKLIQQYYKVVTIEEETNEINIRLSDANVYLSQITEVIFALQSVIEDYENFKQGITVPLNNIDASNTEIETYVRTISEDVATIKAIFHGDTNLREMLETLWDIKGGLEYFQQQWDAQNTDIHEMFLDPFDNSGLEEPYSMWWKYFDRDFDPLWTWSNGQILVDVTPSEWGAFDDICNSLLAIIKGNEAMNYNLAYLCQGVTVIASNLMNGVDMDAKYREFQNEFQERSAVLMQQFNSLSEYQDGFSSVDSSQVTAIFDSQVQNFQNTFSRYSVQQLDDQAVVTLNGLGGFGVNVSSVSGSLDMGSYSVFFVAARAVFGFLYWVIEFGFILWLIGKCLNLYKFTLRMFCTLPRQVSN